jgi:hypothetical protein
LVRSATSNLLTAHQHSLTLLAVYARYPIWFHLWFLTEALWWRSSLQSPSAFKAHIRRSGYPGHEILMSAAQFRPLPNVVVTDCGRNDDLMGRHHVDPLM